MKSKLHQIFSCSLTVHEYKRLVLFIKKNGRYSWTHTLSMLTYLSYCVIVSNDSLPGIQNWVFFLVLSKTVYQLRCFAFRQLVDVLLSNST